MCISRCWQLLLLLNDGGLVDHGVLALADKHLLLLRLMLLIHSFDVRIHLGGRGRNLRGNHRFRSMNLFKSVLANQ